MPRNGKLNNITREDLAPIWGQKKVTVTRMAEALGCHRSAVVHRARRLGLPDRGPGREWQKKIDDETFVDLWEKRVCTTEIASLAGYCHRGAVSTRRRMLGLPRREHLPVGHPDAKGGGWPPTISLADYREIKLAELWESENA